MTQCEAGSEPGIGAPVVSGGPGQCEQAVDVEPELGRDLATGDVEIGANGDLVGDHRSQFRVCAAHDQLRVNSDTTLDADVESLDRTLYGVLGSLRRTLLLIDHARETRYGTENGGRLCERIRRHQGDTRNHQHAREAESRQRNLLLRPANPVPVQPAGRFSNRDGFCGECHATLRHRP